MARLTDLEWDEFLKKFPDAHLLQTSQWGKLKSQHGWTPFYLANEKAGAQVLFRDLILGLKIAYIPKGPLGQDWQDLIPEVLALCKEQQAIVLYVEPDCWQDEVEGIANELDGFTLSDLSIQPRRTITISLEGSEDEWLARMKQKTRYNIRLAAKKDVIVKKSDDVDAFNMLMRETGSRDEFGIHQPDYYRMVYELFHPLDACEMFIAYYEEQPLAAIMALKWGKRAWYFYGASNNKERNRMPTYPVQWEAMQWAAQAGCLEYDLWGVPDEDEPILEEQFSSRSDGLWGVYRFKRGFGGELKRTAGIYAKILRPGFFSLYQLADKIRKSITA